MAYQPLISITTPTRKKKVCSSIKTIVEHVDQIRPLSTIFQTFFLPSLTRHHKKALVFYEPGDNTTIPTLII